MPPISARNVPLGYPSIQWAAPTALMAVTAQWWSATSQKRPVVRAGSQPVTACRARRARPRWPWGLRCNRSRSEHAVTGQTGPGLVVDGAGPVEVVDDVAEDPVEAGRPEVDPGIGEVAAGLLLDPADAGGMRQEACGQVVDLVTELVVAGAPVGIARAQLHQHDVGTVGSPATSSSRAGPSLPIVAESRVTYHAIRCSGWIALRIAPRDSSPMESPAMATDGVADAGTGMAAPATRARTAQATAVRRRTDPLSRSGTSGTPRPVVLRRGRR